VGFPLVALVTTKPNPPRCKDEHARVRSRYRLSRVSIRRSIAGRDLEEASAALATRARIRPDVIEPADMRNLDVTTPAGRAALFLGMHTYFGFMSMLVGFYLAIDTTVGESVRGSLSLLAIHLYHREAVPVNAATFLRNTSLGPEKNT
jgi:hypothetical protein